MRPVEDRLQIGNTGPREKCLLLLDRPLGRGGCLGFLQTVRFQEDLQNLARSMCLGIAQHSLTYMVTRKLRLLRHGMLIVGC